MSWTEETGEVTCTHSLTHADMPEQVGGYNNNNIIFIEMRQCQTIEQFNLRHSVADS